MNQARIAKTLCVEKDVKDSKCGGCCQLKKSLAEENTDEGTIPTEQKQSEMVFQLINENLSEKLPRFKNGTQLFWSVAKSTLCTGIQEAVFHPPDVVC